MGAPKTEVMVFNDLTLEITSHPVICLLFVRCVSKSSSDMRIGDYKRVWIPGRQWISLGLILGASHYSGESQFNP